MKKSRVLKSFIYFIKPEITLTLIILLGIIARMLFYSSIDGVIQVSDSPTYIGAAKSLYEHFGLNEYRPPVYPMGILLAGILSGWQFYEIGTIFLQVLLSLTNIVFIYKLSFEAFRSRFAAYLASLVTSISFRIFSWDFIILSENFSILIVTLVCYFCILHLKYKQFKYLKHLIFFLLIGIFTKPFFLLLPFGILIIFLLRYIIFKDFDFKPFLMSFLRGLAVIYLSVMVYSAVNYFENLHFGISTVGNVNSFGKVLQYHMEDLGKNEALLADIKNAFHTEKPEFKVEGRFLEPWHFIGTYGWSNNHYSDIGKFASGIILTHPTKYLIESTILTCRLFFFTSPFGDYIAQSAIEKSGHVNNYFPTIRKITDIFDNFYIILILGLFEFLFAFLHKGFRRMTETHYYIGVLMIIIIYHYVISAFLSYGDYCRLITPCYPLIYSILSLYFFRFFRLLAGVLKNTKEIVQKKSDT